MCQNVITNVEVRNRSVTVCLARVDCGERGVVGVDDHVLAVYGHAVQAQVEVAGGAAGALRLDEGD